MPRQRPGEATHAPADGWASAPPGVGATPSIDSRLQDIIELLPDAAFVIDSDNPGLSISGKLADKLGGELAVASELGRGTTVAFELPVSERAAAPLPGEGVNQ